MRFVADLSVRTIAGTALVSLVLVGCGVRDEADAHPSEAAFETARASLPAGLFALRGTDPAAPTDDLAPLAALADGAEMVGLGESIHTSGGFHAMRTRVIEYLIRERGFRTVMLETPMNDASVTARFVEGEGTVDAAPGGIFPVFASVEMKSLLEFMAAWNVDHPSDRVHFMGFDIQEPWSNAGVLRDFLSGVSPDDASSLMAPVVASCLGAKFASEEAWYEAAETQALFDGTTIMTAEPHQQCLSSLWTIELKLDTLGGCNPPSSAALFKPCLARASMTAYEDQMYFLYAEQSLRQQGLAEAVRDRGMAANITALRRAHATEGKTVIIAHNAHLEMDASSFEAEIGQRPMGASLKDTWGPKYAPIALVAEHTEINWGQFLPPTDPPPGSVEAILDPLGPFLFLDFQRQSADAPLIAEGHTYPMGDPRAQAVVEPAKQFRGLVFLHHSPAMVYAQ